MPLSESLSFEQIEQIATGTGKESSNIISTPTSPKKKSEISISKYIVPNFFTNVS